MKLAALLVLALQAPEGGVQEAPFRFKLPDEYQAFQQRDKASDAWVAPRNDGKAQFLVEHWLLEHGGAYPAAVAQYRRDHLWLPQLQNMKPKIEAWSGKWAQRPAAGNHVAYQVEDEPRALIERLVVLGDHLIIGTWEGPAPDRMRAARALQTFRIPEAWMASPPIEHDAQRGTASKFTSLPAPGSLAVFIDIGDGSRAFMEVRVELTPDMKDDGSLIWDVPIDSKVVLSPGQPRVTRRDDLSVAVRPDKSGNYAVRYRIALDRENNELEHLGIHFQSGTAAFLDPAWLAVPRISKLPDSREGRYLPPEWQMRVEVPAAMTAISGAATQKEWLEEESATRILSFGPVPAGQGWPFVLVGQYRTDFLAQRTLLVRQGSRSSAPDAAIAWLNSLSLAFESWLPGSAGDWRVATFPGAGDRTLPGIVLLDENDDWLRDPLDAEWNGLNRRIGLARRIATRPFGSQWRGTGSGAGFLEASLGEYAAWRLLQATAYLEDAERLMAAWKQREALVGDLPLPLSLMATSDLQGPQRLISRGALVWVAIERKATRKVFDESLRAAFAQGSSWSTEDLRAALEQRTGTDWMPFFDSHLYGCAMPAID